ncbi:MAG: hypothetical protein KDA52_21535 [Planctomycetaceae bacterium]|nr:hypothetical protein [Planctomycetaceae bacterium]
MCPSKLQLVLTDANPAWNGQQEITFVVEPRGVSIETKGYGDFGSAEGHGSPMYLELYQGTLRLLVWPDMREEEPTIIDLAGAREHSSSEGHLRFQTVQTNNDHGEPTDADLRD